MAKVLMPILNEHKRDLLKKATISFLTAEIISEYPDVLFDKLRLNKRKKCAELLYKEIDGK